MSYKSGYTGPQIDSNLALSATSVQIAGAQSVGGVKTFSDNAAFITGKGIDFSANSNSGHTSTSDVLTDYEEGTWIPVLSAGTTTTYGTTTAVYAKVGKLVCAIFDMTINSIGNGSTYRINGLPYACNANTMGICSVGYFSTLAQGVVYLSGYVDTSSIFLTGLTVASTAIEGNLAVIKNGTRIAMSVVYQTA